MAEAARAGWEFTMLLSRYRRKSPVLDCPPPAIEKDLTVIINGTSAYVNWWSNTVTDLNSIKIIMKFVSNNDEAKKKVLEKWEGIQQEFQAYVQEVD
jgi:hypothetical protein